MESFEVLLQNDSVTGADWQRFIRCIAKHEHDFLMEVTFGMGTMQWYLYTQKDISILGSSAEGFVLQRMNRLAPIYSPSHRVRFTLDSHKNILEQLETQEINRHRQIYRILIGYKQILRIEIYVVTIFFRDDHGAEHQSSYISFANPLTCFEIDFTANVKIQKKATPPYLKLGEVTRLFTPHKTDGFLEVNGFPYISRPMYVSLDTIDIGKHTVLVGQTGVGKSKCIELFVQNIAKYARDDYVVVVVDPHASLSFPSLNRTKSTFDYIRTACSLFSSQAEPKIATELTILLFKTLLQDQWTAKTERVLKYAVFILLVRNQMSLVNLRTFFTDLRYRNEVLHVLDASDDFLIHFFQTEFIELQTKYYEVAIAPIVTLLDELSFIPALSMGPENSLEQVLNDNFLVNFSLNRVYLGEKATKLIAGFIIQQLFLFAQKKTMRKKIILIVDEVSLVENESLPSVLAEARKFRMSLVLSQQYLTQITPQLLKGILSNAYNYFVFKVSDEDAKTLSKNLDIVFPDELLEKQKEKGGSEEDLKRNMFVTLGPRECLVRIFSNGRFYPCFKARTLDVG